MTWYTDGNTGIIRDGDRVVGSVYGGPHFVGGEVWRCEIMWGGPGGDIVCITDSFEKALCFIEGVEQAFDRWTQIVRNELTPP